MDKLSRADLKIANYIKKYIAPIVIITDDQMSDNEIQTLNNYRASLYSKESLSIWKLAFRHKSSNPNPNKNYEFLEFQGDKLMSAIFTQYIKERFPDIMEAEASVLVASYLRTDEQAKLADILSLPKYLESYDSDVLSRIPDIKEDLLEAFFGALFIVSNMIMFGYGYITCYNLLVYLYTSVDIDFKRSYGDPKTQVKEIFQFLGGGDKYLNQNAELSQTIFDKGREQWRFILRLDNNMLKRLSEIYPNLKNRVVADYSDKTKELTETTGYRRALDQLEIYGIHRLDIIKAKRQIKNIDKDLHDRAEKKAKRKGYTQIYFTKSSGDIQFIQLIGIKKDGVHVILLTKDKGNMKLNKLYESILRDYLN